MLIKAFNLIDVTNIRLVIAGHGPLSNHDRKMISCNPNIILINQKLSEAEKKILFQNCFLYVFPSISANEAFGITQLEAMAYGKPVINTHLETGVPFVSIHDETGITIPPGDVNALRKAIVDLFELDESSYNRLSQACKTRVKSLFDDTAVKQQILSIYASMKQL